MLTDREPQYLDDSGGITMTLACETTGPFESTIGLTALLNALVAAVAVRLRPSVTARLDRLQNVWSEVEAFEQ